MPMNMNHFESMKLKGLNVIKEIDFEHDIDIDKSAGFEINQQKKRLELLYEENDRIELGDFKETYGKIHKYGSGISIVPEVNDKFGDISYASAALLYDKVIFDESKDVVHTQFEYSDDSHFYFRLFNQSLYTLTLRAINKEISYDSKLFNEAGNKSIEFVFNCNQLMVVKRIGGVIDYSNKILIPLKDRLINMMINRKDHCVWVNGEKYRVPVLSLLRQNETYLSILTFIKQEKFIGSIANIKHVICGHSEGYLYLKPQIVEDKNLKVFMVYGGNPILQYYSVNSNEWLGINNDQTINAEQLLHLRIKGGFDDYVYKIIIAENRQ